jgi:polar amino acid transport system permease protein
MDVLLPRSAYSASRLSWRECLFNPLTVSVLFGGLAVSLIGTAWAQDDVAQQGSMLGVLLKWTPLLAQGFGYNILISLLAMMIGTCLGVGLGVLQVSLAKPVRGAAWLVTQFFRNSPWLVLLFYSILLIPFEVEIFGQTIPLPGWAKAVVGLSLPVMAYMSEYVRGAIQSVPSGQWESADSLGFSRGQSMRMIILPQTVKRILPNWMNLYAVLTMATPLVSIVGVDDIMGYARSALSAEGRVDALVPMYLYVLCWFFAYCYPISLVTLRLERRFAVKL